MERFLTRHSSRIAGVVSGFDRLLFRGTLRSISFVDGMDRFLASQRILYKDFAGFAGRDHDASADPRRGAGRSRRAGRSSISRSSSISKDARARERSWRAMRITEGLVCIFSCVESCMTLTVRGDRATKRLRLVREERRCVFLYFYYVDRDFGLMHIRLQTWLPLTIQVYVNGREWLARQLTAAGLAFDTAGQRPHPQRRAPDAGDQRAAAGLRLGTVADALRPPVNPWLDPGRACSAAITGACAKANLPPM